MRYDNIDVCLALCPSQPTSTHKLRSLSQVDFDDKKESSSAAARSLPASISRGSGLGPFNLGETVRNDSSTVNIMLNGQRLEMRQGAVDITSSFQEGFLQRRRAALRLSPSGIPDDASYQRALASLRHREAMLSLDKAIHEAEMRRRISSMTSNLSSSFPSNLPHELSNRRHGTTLPSLVPSSVNPTLFSMPTATALMSIGGASGQSQLGSFSGPGRSLRTNLIHSELPTRASSTAMASILSSPGSLRQMHQRAPVGTIGRSNFGSGAVLDRESLEQLNKRANSHHRGSPER